MIDKNGFSPPLHPYQICTWIIFSFHSISPVLLVFPYLDQDKSIIFLALFYLSHLGVLITGFLCTRSNPTITKSKEPLYLETVENLNFYCTICESYVTRTAKHCGSCDRCVHGFDHHCKWLNNCVGETNYKLFIVLLVSVFLNELILFCFEIRVILSKRAGRVETGFNLFDAVMNGLILFLLAYLISIHVMLRFKGMTTYEYIKAARKQKEKRINPIPEAPKTQENIALARDIDVKKSIIKSESKQNNKTVEENPFSFSVPKASLDDMAHLTMQIHCESQSE